MKYGKANIVPFNLLFRVSGGLATWYFFIFYTNTAKERIMGLTKMFPSVDKFIKNVSNSYIRKNIWHFWPGPLQTRRLKYQNNSDDINFSLYFFFSPTACKPLCWLIDHCSICPVEDGFSFYNFNYWIYFKFL